MKYMINDFFGTCFRISMDRKRCDEEIAGMDVPS